MHWIIASTCLILSTFAAVGRSLESGIWDGHVTFGHGSSSFTPCGSKETWWVKSKGYTKTADQLKDDYLGIAEKPYEQVYIRVRGEVSRKGQYGRLGSYQRVLYVEEVLDIHTQREDDCPMNPPAR